MANKWRIEGWGSTEKIFEATAPANLGDREVVAMLQRLVARHLTPREIVCGSLRRNHRGYAPHLERIGSGAPISVGSDPHYIAFLIDEAGHRIARRRPEV